MQNQLRTESETKSVYTSPAPAQTDLATTPDVVQTELATAFADVQTDLATPSVALQTERTLAETQSVQNTQAVHAWLANIQQNSRRDKIRLWTVFLALWLAAFLPLHLSSFVPFSNSSSDMLITLFVL